MVDKGVIVLDWMEVDEIVMKKVNLVMFFIFDLIGVVVNMVVVCIEVLV